MQVGVRLNSAAGLGSMSNQTVSMDEGGNLTRTRKKAEVKFKTQQRFDRVKLLNIFGPEDDEEGTDGM